MTPRRFSGRRLREKRIAARLKPEQLGLRVDRSVYSIHQYERETALPSVSVLAALSAALGCPIDDLFTTDQEVAGVAS